MAGHMRTRALKRIYKEEMKILWWGLMTIQVIGTGLMRHMKPGNSLTRAALYASSCISLKDHTTYVPLFSCNVTRNLPGYQSTVCDNVSKYRQVTPSVTGNIMLQHY